MASPSYCKLIDQLCELTMIPTPSAFYEQANLSVKEVDFSLKHTPSVGEGDVFIYASFGPLPTANREAVLQRLLETNLYLLSGPFCPSLSYNRDSELVILIGHVPLENLSAEHLLGLMGGVADMALIWREGYFFDGAATGRDAKPTQAPNPIKRNAGLNSALSL
ncbi:MULTISPECIES: CesT family type III secretion system chaperone [Pseudomonas]|uniref:CesT family type III secretion system chaperone n=1 Tax=Pseudomonas TaxID=286 RepID=UPI001BEA916E|nr:MULTISPECIES: CesT family type III secretion system chaperone [Pseudomonas]MBT2340262.1 CesT family type III secretion system chaperone [Pseudomonas fluorescens]MCD4530270.1 CesT family type III secretion system chaperone [Pseudomonas sp. C3-2018]